MDNDTLNKLFNNLDGTFDVEIPEKNHEQRFLNKLNQNTKVVSMPKHKTLFWKPFIGIAASLALIAIIILINNTNETTSDLASISPDLAQTEGFFVTTINQELQKLNKETAPEAKALIHDTLKQLAVLENQYEELKQDLIESGNDKRVIYAMISNFQSRIDLLQNVLKQIEHIKLLKQTTYETPTTI